jgi:T5SS/PEP-CTERM-associated repeat protein
MRRATSLSLLVAGILLASSGSALRAVVIEWNNPAGGTFSDGANWVGGKAPTATDRAVFDNSAEYVVNFGADASTSGLTIGTEKITLQLNGQSYNTGDPFNPAVIGTDTADVARLVLLNGVLKAGRVEVGDPSGAQGYLQIGKAATLHLTESKSVRMTVSNGELRVIEGGSITSAPDARIGVGSPRTNNSPISSATFVVDGLGSTVTTSEVNLGVGSLTVQSGGLISAYYVSLRQSDLDLKSSALVTGLNTKLLASSTISVGGATLNITDQATVQTIDFNISSGSDDARFTEGVVVVSDGGKLVASDDFRIGGTLYLSDGTVIPGKGTLKVVESGEFTSRSTMIAGGDNNVGLVEIDGVGSTWYNSAEIHVGRNGHGKLVVSGGGQVTGGNVPNFASAIGYWTDSEGEVLLTDEGSAWTLSSPLHVGALGHGSLTIQNGADLSNTTSAIASIADSSGHALVTGAGSTWTSSKNMGIGGDANLPGGSGELEIADSGLVKVAGSATVWETGSVHLDAGTLQATTINLSGGSLGGIGTVIGNLNNSGEVSPGNSPGTLKVQGNFSQSIEGLLKFEIGSAASDLLQVTGNATLGGTLHLSLLGGFKPGYGTTYDLLTASKLSGAFDTLELPDLGPGRSWQFNYGADRFTVTAVPEPSTIVLGIVGIGSVVLLGMRRRARAGAKLSTTRSAGRAAAFVVALFLIVPTARSADVFWGNPAGGTFSDGTNWVGGKAPASTDRVFFDSQTSPTVSFAGDTTSNGVWIRRDDITFQLNGHTYTPSGTSGAINVGSVIGDNARLTLLDGSLRSLGIAIGGLEGSYGEMTVGSGASFELNNLASGAVIFNGKLSVVDGGTFSTGPNSNLSISPPDIAGTSAALVVDGEGSTVDASNLSAYRGSLLISDGGHASAAEYVGLHGRSPSIDLIATVTGKNSILEAGKRVDVKGASLHVQDFGAVSTPYLWVGAGTGDAKYLGGIITVEDPGTVVSATIVSVGGHVAIPPGSFVGEEGTLEIKNGGELRSAEASIANTNDTIGLVVIEGEGSKWTNTADFRIGNEGYGSLHVSNGGRVFGGNNPNLVSQIGASADSHGDVVLTDPGSTWQLSCPLYVGVSGNGDLSVQNGATLANTTSAIGWNINSTGHALVTGAGSTWTTSKNMGIGGDFAFAGGAGQSHVQTAEIPA